MKPTSIGSSSRRVVAGTEDTAGANEDSALSGSALMQEARRGGGWQPSHGPIGRADGGAIVHGKSDIIHGNTRGRYMFHGT